MATRRKSTGVRYHKPSTLKQRVKQIVRKIAPKKRATRRTKKTLH